MSGRSTSPRRVLMTADTVGGVWTYAMELTGALENRGVDVMLATMGAPLNRSQRAEIHSRSNLEVFESDYKLEWMDDPWEDVEQAGYWLLDLEKQTSPEVIHLNSFSHGSLPWRTPKLIVGHSCVLSWWQAVKQCHAPAEWNAYRHCVKSGLQSAELVVTPSRAMDCALQQHYGPIAPSAVIPNGRQLRCSARVARREIILSAGRTWDEGKNISMLAATAAKLTWPVCVAGESRSPEGRGHAYPNVHHLGPLPPGELLEWYERAGIYVLPARYEPFGLSILEAALAGCALVIGDIPSLRETWADAALFVPPDDVEALREMIERLIASPSLRDRLSARAREIGQNYSPDRMAAAYVAAYETVMKQGPVPGPEKELFICES